MGKVISKLVKVVLVVVIILALFVGGFCIYLQFFVPKPEKTIENFMKAIEEEEINDLIECCDPKVKKFFDSMLGLGGDLLGSLTKISVDLQDLLTVVSFLDISDDEEGILGEAMSISDLRVVCYSDYSAKKLQKMIDEMSESEINELSGKYLSNGSFYKTLHDAHLMLPKMENLGAKSCLIVFYEEGSVEANYAVLGNYGSKGWRIYFSME